MYVTAAKHLIGDMSLDSTGAFNTEEQTHLIQIGGTGILGVTGMQIDRVRFWHPALAGRQAGDCHSARR